MKTIKTNDERIFLNLNSKNETKGPKQKNTKDKTKNMKGAKPKYKQIFIAMK
jgi:hypothetical protein